MDIYLEKLLKQHQRLGAGMATARILELNPGHPLVKRLAALADADGAEDTLSDAAYLLLDQARIIEGETPPDPVAFSRRLASVMEKGLAAV
jgi:molecular chaperone HtpG